MYKSPGVAFDCKVSNFLVRRKLLLIDLRTQRMQGKRTAHFNPFYILLQAEMTKRVHLTRLANLVTISSLTLWKSKCSMLMELISVFGPFSPQLKI